MQRSRSTKGSKKNETRDNHGFPLVKGEEDLLTIKRLGPQIPSDFHPYISRMQDVIPDGHCVYRSVAVGLGYPEHAWPRIRHDLLLEIYLNESVWTHVFDRWDEGDFIRIRDSISWHSVEGCPESHWMEMPHVGLLIAQRYNIILHVLSIQGSFTYFPLTVGPINPRPQAITTLHVNRSHYIHVKLESDYPMPTVNPMWSAHRTLAAEQWEDMYRPRLQHYHSIVNPKKSSDRHKAPSIHLIEDSSKT